VLHYLARRLIAAVVLVAVVSSGALLLTRLAPGDFASELFGVGRGAESIARERARYGLDQPIGRQYLTWLASAARLDFGASLLYRRPVTGLVAERALNTSLLALAALALATLLGLPAGILTGSRPRGLLASSIRGLSLVLLSLPSLVTSLVLVIVAARTGWLPTGGMQTAGAWEGGLLAGLFDVARHVPLPALAIALPLAATIERVQSQSMRDTLRLPFVLSASALGVPPRRLVWRTALRPALGPVAAIYGFIAGSLLSGSFVVEVVTSWPGLGRLMYDALRARDLFLVAGCAAAGALFLAAGSFLSDLLQAWADPRLREREDAVPAVAGV
jgi:peptide/nickel transport system permease protein